MQTCRRSLAAVQALHAEDPDNVLYGIDVAQGKVPLVDLLLAAGDRVEARAETARAIAYLKPLANADPPNRYYLVDYVTILTAGSRYPFGAPGLGSRQPGGHKDPVKFDASKIS